MNIKKNLLISFLSILTISCTQNERKLLNQDSQFSHSDFESVTKITGQPLNKISDSLIFPSSIGLVGDYLLIAERSPGNLVHIINLKNETHLGRFGSRGMGPGEVPNAWKLFPFNFNDIGILDHEIGKILIYNKDSIIQDKGLKGEYTVKEAMHSNGVIEFDEKFYILGNYNEDSRLIVGKTTDSLSDLRQFGNFPKLNLNYEKLNDFDQKTTLNQAEISNCKDIALISYFNIPLFQIINLSTNQEVNIVGPDPLPSNELIGELKYYYSSIITENFIYLLYITDKKEFKYVSNTVLVFDHSGKPRKKIILDKEVYQITVYEDNYLYGLTYDNDEDPFTLYKYTLE
ncbi:BF3164 family lipoprotein [Algoriphagus hitonicola]|uniref:TolB-like 6-blade propeller-like n=1 Tax=Algoriphagus hitonicola TaxID=435880 RepID=A0A1I2NLL0_9BACT|nr:BF3164 family lipoprotein [Algoriphagus hitonicola]SFG03669.1 TolB-like 6-blade propeller-like [Algoriphagus hitonicola]